MSIVGSKKHIVVFFLFLLSSMKIYANDPCANGTYPACSCSCSPSTQECCISADGGYIHSTCGLYQDNGGTAGKCQ